MHTSLIRFWLLAVVLSAGCSGRGASAPAVPGDAGSPADAASTTQPADAGSPRAGESCAGNPGGTVETRKRYPRTEAPAGEVCEPEIQTRVCLGETWSAWSGTAEAESCVGCEDADGDGRGVRCPERDCDDADAHHWSDCGACDDGDGDGYGPGCDLGPDCDDTDAAINPGMSDVPWNYVDENCDGRLGRHLRTLTQVPHRESAGLRAALLDRGHVYAGGEVRALSQLRNRLGAIQVGQQLHAGVTILGDSEQGFTVATLAEPTGPLVKRGALAGEFEVVTLSRGGHLAAAQHGSGSSPLTLFDLADPDRPRAVASIESGESSCSTWPMALNDRVLVAGCSFNARVYDLEDPSDPQFVTEFPQWEFQVLGDMAYGFGDEGFWRVDLNIDDPQPEFVGPLAEDHRAPDVRWQVHETGIYYHHDNTNLTPADAPELVRELCRLQPPDWQPVCVNFTGGLLGLDGGMALLTSAGVERAVPIQALSADISPTLGPADNVWPEARQHRIGRHASQVVIHDGHLVRASAGGIHLLDPRRSGQQRWVSGVALGAVLGVAIDGNTAYVPIVEGLGRVDLTDLTAPRLLSVTRGATMTTPLSILAVKGEKFLLGGPGYAHGPHVLDLDPVPGPLFTTTFLEAAGVRAGSHAAAGSRVYVRYRSRFGNNPDAGILVAELEGGQLREERRIVGGAPKRGRGDLDRRIAVLEGDVLWTRTGRLLRHDGKTGLLVRSVELPFDNGDVVLAGDVIFVVSRESDSPPSIWVVDGERVLPASHDLQGDPSWTGLTADRSWLVGYGRAGTDVLEIRED